MLNNAEASLEIRRLFYAAWTTRVTALNLKRRDNVTVYVPQVKWEDVQKTDFNDNGVHWLHFQLRNIATRQASFPGGRIEEIGTRYTTRGYAKIQMYFSKSAYRTADKDAIEEIVQSIFYKQSTPCGVWFRNPTIFQLAPEESFLRSMVTADYVFDTMVQ